MMKFPRFWPAVFSLSYSVWDTSPIHGLGPLLQLDIQPCKSFDSLSSAKTYISFSELHVSEHILRQSNWKVPQISSTWLLVLYKQSYWLYPLSTNHPIYPCLKTKFLEFSFGWLSLLRVYLYFQCSHCRVTWNLKCSGINLLLKHLYQPHLCGSHPSTQCSHHCKVLSVYWADLGLSCLCLLAYFIHSTSNILFFFTCLPGTTSCGEFLFAF